MQHLFQVYNCVEHQLILVSLLFIFAPFLFTISVLKNDYDLLYLYSYFYAHHKKY